MEAKNLTEKDVKCLGYHVGHVGNSNFPLQRGCPLSEFILYIYNGYFKFERRFVLFRSILFQRFTVRNNK